MDRRTEERKPKTIWSSDNETTQKQYAKDEIERVTCIARTRK
jgi:hypothetical protein